MLVKLKTIQEIKFKNASIIISEEQLVFDHLIVLKELVYSIFIQYRRGKDTIYTKQIFEPEVWNNSIKQLSTNVMIGKLKAKLKEEQWKDLN